MTKESWRGPTIADVARAAGVGTATVDRVLNSRGAVRQQTRERVLAAFDELRFANLRAQPSKHRIAVLADSGTSFSRTLRETVESAARGRDRCECSFESVSASEVDAVTFAQLIERRAKDVDALVVVARESPVINRALRAVGSRHIPIVCVTTDLPNSGRLTYIGCDQPSAGATAAYLMGKFVGPAPGKILLVVTAPYRSQEEREIGFRRVLRSEFPHLTIDDRIGSNDDSEYSFRQVSRYIEEHGPPVGIYNVAGDNLGVGKAIVAHELQGKTVFIGHELNANSLRLMESGAMDIVIEHDLDQEVGMSLDYLTALLDNEALPTVSRTRVRVFTKYNFG
jgi:LacI family transcriptional regulator